jgi:hypothetical protein
VKWNTEPPTRPGRYYVIDRCWEQHDVGEFNGKGWTIRGRHVGIDGAICWTELHNTPQELMPKGVFDG